MRIKRLIAALLVSAEGVGIGAGVATADDTVDQTTKHITGVKY